MRSQFENMSHILEAGLTNDYHAVVEDTYMSQGPAFRHGPITGVSTRTRI